MIYLKGREWGEMMLNGHVVSLSSAHKYSRLQKDNL